VDRYTTELRDRMERKDIPYVEDMLAMAQLEGVKFLACKTSADLFDLGERDFIEGVEIMLAGDFMKQASGSDLHLIF
jgi:predicted peroxiredoxin